jgi:hypothetical protein
MELTQEEHQQIIKDAIVEKIKERISTNLVVNPSMLAEFLYEELKQSRVTITNLKK